MHMVSTSTYSYWCNNAATLLKVKNNFHLRILNFKNLKFTYDFVYLPIPVPAYACHKTRHMAPELLRNKDNHIRFTKLNEVLLYNKK